MIIIIVFRELINMRMRMRFVLSSFIERIYMIELSLLRITLISYSFSSSLVINVGGCQSAWCWLENESSAAGHSSHI